MTVESLTARITELQTELASVSAAFDAKKAEVMKMNEQWQAYGAKAQQRVTHLEGRIAEATKMKGELEAIAPPPSPEGAPPPSLEAPPAN